MVIKNAKFVKSVADSKGLPSDKPEFVFAGKSNSGKSSLINALVNQKRLAISSSTPGRTRLVNFFEVNGQFYFVDLPGYGFSQSGKSAELTYSNLIEDYLGSSKRIKRVFILIDCRNGISENDEILIKYCYGRLPFTIICTKADKLAISKANLNKIKIANDLGLGKDDVVLCSSTNKKGIDKILDIIEGDLNAI